MGGPEFDVTGGAPCRRPKGRAAAWRTKGQANEGAAFHFSLQGSHIHYNVSPNLICTPQAERQSFFGSILLIAGARKNHICPDGRGP